MNLLNVVASMDPRSGGLCAGLRNSIPELEKLGVYSEVLCLDTPTASFLRIDSFKIHALGDSKNPWRYSNKLLNWLIENIARFDTIIVHGIWLYHSYSVNKAIQFLKNRSNNQCEKKEIPKFFVMPHGMLDPYFQRAPGRKFKSIRNLFYWKLVESKVINNADGLLFTCEQELLLAREPFQSYLPKSEINVGFGISNPPAYTDLMTQAFRTSCPKLQNHPYLLFLGRIHEKKGVDILINAYTSLVKKRASKHQFPKLVIAGPGIETTYGKKIIKMISQDSQLQQSILFCGMLTGNAKWGAFYGCEAFVLPSHQENFGVAIIEAMACEKPVLISNQVNIWREIKQEGGGMVADDNEKSVSGMLDQWTSLPDSARKLSGQKALTTYKKYFAVRASAEKLLKAISS